MENTTEIAEIFYEFYPTDVSKFTEKLAVPNNSKILQSLSSSIFQTHTNKYMKLLKP